MISFIEPDWPAPELIKSIVTSRCGGVSSEPWNSLNLATHVNDDAKHVAENRRLLTSRAHLPAEPEWLNQTHSVAVIDLDRSLDRDGDASITMQKNTVAVVLTADCLPLLVCNKQGSEVAAIHAGWKGLLDGIVTKTLQTMQSKPHDLMVWLGPAISQAHFEVGDEVKQQFCAKYNNARRHFKAQANHKWLADLYALAHDQLAELGVSDIYGGDFCSYAEQDKFYSYRRDGETGRMASLIWIDDAL